MKQGIVSLFILTVVLMGCTTEAGLEVDSSLEPFPRESAPLHKAYT
jgi:hypothetical protein